MLLTSLSVGFLDRDVRTPLGKSFRHIVTVSRITIFDHYVLLLGHYSIISFLQQIAKGYPPLRTIQQ